MEKQDFTTIITALDQHIQACKNHLDEILTTKDLENLTLAQAAELKSFCSTEYQAMTKIVMVEFYHIVGMGKLSPTQMMTFVYKMKEYLQYRPDITNIATNFDSIDHLPGLPTRTKYKLGVLCNLTLESSIRACGDSETSEITEITELPEDEINYCDSIKLDNKDKYLTDTITELRSNGCKELPYDLDGTHILVNKNNIDDFFTVCHGLNCRTGDLETFRKKITNLKSAYGINWFKISNDIYFGKTEAIHYDKYKALKKLFKKY